MISSPLRWRATRRRGSRQDGGRSAARSRLGVEAGARIRRRIPKDRGLSPVRGGVFRGDSCRQRGPPARLPTPHPSGDFHRAKHYPHRDRSQALPSGGPIARPFVRARRRATSRCSARRSARTCAATVERFGDREALVVRAPGLPRDLRASCGTQVEPRGARAARARRRARATASASGRPTATSGSSRSTRPRASARSSSTSTRPTRRPSSSTR